MHSEGSAARGLRGPRNGRRRFAAFGLPETHRRCAGSGRGGRKRVRRQGQFGEHVIDRLQAFLRVRVGDIKFEALGPKHLRVAPRLQELHEGERIEVRFRRKGNNDRRGSGIDTADADRFALEAQFMHFNEASGGVRKFPVAVDERFG